MSRRSNKNSAANKGGPLASHPLEMNPEHRKFLIRSLDRCDTEFAALVKLNRSLAKVKQELIDICGGSESLLLDLGDGSIRLNATGDGLEGIEVAHGTQRLCLDFLSRRKLRRRLLNRLSRRLQRLAHSLDGKDITPPFPPKYGDIRMVIDAEAIANFRIELKEKEEAKKRIRLKIEEEEEPKGNIEEEESKTTDCTEESKTTTRKEEDVEMTDAISEEKAVSEEKVDNGASPIEDAPPSTESTNAETVSSSTTETDPAPVASSDTKLPEKEVSFNASSPKQELSSSTKPSEEIEPLLDPDYAMIREFNSAYEKTLNLTTGETTYNLLNTSSPDTVPASVGIGGRHMTPQEKEAELKRWQTSVLMKIADQPTAKELGFENRVFNLEERRRIAKKKEKLSEQKGASEDGGDEEAVKETEGSDSEEVGKEIENSDNEEDNDSDEEAGKETPSSGDEEDKDEKEENDAEKENAKSKTDSMEEDEKTGLDEGGEEDERDSKESEADDKKVEEKKDTKKDSKDDANETNSTEEKGDDNESNEERERNRNIELEPPPKRVKPMSLTPFPSFYNQDLRRIRLLHADLMATSLHQHVRRRIAEVTHDYNRAYQTSLDICVKRNKFQSELNQLSHTHRLDLEKLKNDYAVQVSMARNQYQKRKEAWELQNAKKHSMYAPIGTPRTTQAARHPNHVYNNVGVALGRVIDAVAMKFEGNSNSFEPFVQPPAPNFDAIVVGKGETFAQRARRVEVDGRQDLQALNTKLAQAEDGRRRAWRKLCKTKSEFERARADAPLPPLRINASAATPASIAAPLIVPPQQPKHTVTAAPYSAVIAAASNPPTQMVPMQASTASWDVTSPINKYIITHPSQSKYSAAKVRERIASDGTVKPVTLPKRDKDGLFLRPAGRTRKGMSWDAMRGMWVPQL